MKVFFHDDFYAEYTADPAAGAGRMEAVVDALEAQVDFVPAQPADASAISAVHTREHIARVKNEGLYPIAALAAGGALQAAEVGLREPAFALVRPPGHHASAASAWGFCYFNNMAIALTALQQTGRMQTALVLDIDLHFGDGTDNILGTQDWVTVYNPEAGYRQEYLREVAAVLAEHRVDLIGISAGFDHHVQDWGGLLTTDDYEAIGALVREAARRGGGGCFGVLEGGYNHDVLGHNVAALLRGLSGEVRAL